MNKSEIIKTIKVDSGKITIQVDIIYASSFCEHLKQKKVNFIRSEKAIYDKKREHGITYRDHVWNEVIIDHDGDFGNLLLGWNIPSVA